MIIDFHTHSFPAKMAAAVLEQLMAKSCSKAYTDGTNEGLAASMKEAGIDYSLLLPVMTNTKQVEKLNTLAAQTNDNFRETGLMSFGGIHPDTENYKEELKRIADMGLKGIKIHPAYQGCDFDDIRFMRIMECATELGLIIITHAGMDIGIPDHNYTSVTHIEHVMDTVHPDKLVLAHMGGWYGWNEVEQNLAGMPLYMDTAFSLGPIEPAPGMTRSEEESYNMNQEQLLRLMRKHGTDRILFATDSPWSSQKDYMDWFAQMDLTSEERKNIMGENARKLLKI